MAGGRARQPVCQRHRNTPFLILAAADFAENPKHKPPPELTLALQCERWGALPEAGGLYDQPAGLLDRMSASLNVYQAFDNWKSRKAGHEKDWTDNNPKAWAVIQDVNKLRQDVKKSG